MQRPSATPGPGPGPGPVASEAGEEVKQEPTDPTSVCSSHPQ
jgi:hypothetical protein